MVSINYEGRAGNNLFQYAAAYIFAKKFNLSVNSNVIENPFDIPKLNGDSHNSPTIIVTDNNFLQLLQSEKIIPAHYRFSGFFQLKDFVINYRDEIISLFNLSYDKPPKDEVFVMYRIGDIQGSRQMLPIEYYQDALNSIQPKGGYITSDTPEHQNVIQLSKEYNLKLYNNEPLETINFGKNFNNLVLSEGSFSWWVGVLSESENIYFNQRERFWHGDIFVFPEWKSLQYDWEPSCFSSNNHLKCNKIINNK